MTLSSLFFVDQMGFEGQLKGEPPGRIISLVPSQTELLFDLGLEEEIVGVTKFCIHPKDKCKTKRKIGGTKSFDFDAIDALSPDLIIGNKEENYKAGIEKLKKSWPVWMSDIQTLKDAFIMMESLGELLGKKEQAETLMAEINSNFENYSAKGSMRALYLIWKDPYMSIGEDTFIHDMMGRCGFINVLSGRERYPVLEEVEIKRLDPDIILLSSEPFPFKEKHVKEFQKICPNAAVAIVDGEMFSWYGSRLKHVPAYFEAINQKLFS